MPLFAELKRQRQEGFCEFQASLVSQISQGYIARTYVKSEHNVHPCVENTIMKHHFAC